MFPLGKYSMRLGQLARKYGISKKDIISYLKEVDPTLHSLGQNTKLDEQTVILIGNRFGEPEELFDPLNAPVEIEAPEDTPFEIMENENELVEATEELSTPTSTSEGEAIETDKLMELLEDEEQEVDLSNITLIKAPKKELEGLKVVGKIELPEPKPKAKAKKEAKEPKNRRSDAGNLSPEEREKRRLKAKKRKEAYEERQERRRKEKEKKRRKALNKARYQQKVQQAKANKLKHKHQQPKVEEVAIEEPPAPPKTLLGRFWRWMTTY